MNDLVIVATSLHLVPVGIKYAAGDVTKFQMTAESFGLLKHLSVVLTAITAALLIKFCTAGPLSNASTLIDLLADCAMACVLGIVSSGGMTKASIFTRLQIRPYEFEFNLGPVIAATLILIVSAGENVDIASTTTKTGAARGNR